MTISLVTSGGISLKSDPPFDMEREKREPLWGDRSYRTIPRRTTEKDIEVNHLHIKTNYIKKDINVILPLSRMAEFEEERIMYNMRTIGSGNFSFELLEYQFLFSPFPFL